MADNPADNPNPGALPYETESSNSYQWTKAAFELLNAGTLSATVTTRAGVRTAEVRGKCPRCDHDFLFVDVLSAVAGEPVAVLGARMAHGADAYVSLTVSCECNKAHQGRPATLGQGCGINFIIDVLATAG